MMGFASAGDGAGLVRSLTPFVDPLPWPPRRVIVEPTRLTIRLQTGGAPVSQRAPPSQVWTYEGHLPGPTIEVSPACRSRFSGITVSRARCR